MELGLRARATVERVIDGDTLVVSIRWPASIRLTDCWAPERNTPEGQESKRHLERLCPPGSEVIVDVSTGESRVVGDVLSFGRILAEIWREGDQDSVNFQMVDDGFATRRRDG